MSATEKELGALHRELANVLKKHLKGTVIAGYEDPETGEVVPDIVELPSAAIITVAAKFLKDNEITCDVDASNELGELERLVKERQNKMSSLNKEDLASIGDDVAFAAGSA